MLFLAGSSWSVNPLFLEGHLMRLDEFLSSNHVSFERLRHPSTYTANRVAQALHVPGRKMAKSVLVRTTHGYMLVVLPPIAASTWIDSGWNGETGKSSWLRKQRSKNC